MLRLPKCLRSMFKLRAREPGRFALHGVWVYNAADGFQHVQVTDGRVMASATMARDKADDTDPVGGVVVRAENVEDLCRLKPKAEDIRLDVAHADDRAVPAVVGTEAGDLAGSVGRVDGSFPGLDVSWPRSKVRAQVALSAKYLMDAVKAAREAGTFDTVVLTIHDDEHAAVVIEPSKPKASLASMHVALAPVTMKDLETMPYPRTGWSLPSQRPSDADAERLAKDPQMLRAMDTLAGTVKDGTTLTIEAGGQSVVIDHEAAQRIHANAVAAGAVKK